METQTLPTKRIQRQYGKLQVGDALQIVEQGQVRINAHFLKYESTPPQMGDCLIYIEEGESQGSREIVKESTVERVATWHRCIDGRNQSQLVQEFAVDNLEPCNPS